MKLVLATLVLLILVLQYQLWVGDSSVRALNLLEQSLEDQRQINADLQARNRLLEIEVLDLKTGLEAVEERARSELGMIGSDETFVLIIEYKTVKYLKLYELQTADRRAPAHRRRG
ncbi:MAG: septum formation initiator family protein [Pseudohongiellaceae bacterium]